MNFGDGDKGKIIGKEKLEFPSLPIIKDVLLFENITSNHINISQLYDQDLCVIFNHSKCNVIDKHQVQLMKGSRSKNNYYM